MTAAVPDPDAFAALLCDWSMSVAPGDRVGILSTTLAADLAAALNRAVLDRDAWPYIALEPPGAAAERLRTNRTTAPRSAILRAGISVWRSTPPLAPKPA